VEIRWRQNLRKTNNKTLSKLKENQLRFNYEAIDITKDRRVKLHKLLAQFATHQESFSMIKI